jgi:hypothetical protein
MEVLIHCPNVRYAVIQASSKQERPERLVIAYENENCLRDLIAAPSIFGLGFVSREEAKAHLEGAISHAAPSNPGLRIGTIFHAAEERGDVVDEHGLAKRRSVPHRMLQSALAAFIVLFYSKNLVSSLIRMALGASL